MTPEQAQAINEIAKQQAPAKYEARVEQAKEALARINELLTYVNPSSI